MYLVVAGQELNAGYCAMQLLQQLEELSSYCRLCMLAARQVHGLPDEGKRYS